MPVLAVQTPLFIIHERIPMKRFFQILLTSAVSLISLNVDAQNYPIKPIKILLPLPAGGALEIFSRAVAEIASQQLGQAFVIEPHPGGNTIIATDLCTKAVPDGYTLCAITSSVSLNPYLYPKLPYNAVKDLQMITRGAVVKEALVINPSVPVSNLKELVAYSKDNAGKINFGSVGSGSLTHLAPEWIKRETKVDWVHIPYKGAAEVMRAFMAGDVQMIYFSLSNPGIIANINSGKMKGFGVRGNKRNPLIPNVPTFAEMGVADLDMESFWGFAAPAGTPKDIIQKLNAAMIIAMKNPAVLAKLESMGLDPILDTPADAQKYLQDDLVRAEKIVKATGAKIE